jgi:hypothetical protein
MRAALRAVFDTPSSAPLLGWSRRREEDPTLPLQAERAKTTGPSKRRRILIATALLSSAALLLAAALHVERVAGRQSAATRASAPAPVESVPVLVDPASITSGATGAPPAPPAPARVEVATATSRVPTPAPAARPVAKTVTPIAASAKITTPAASGPRPPNAPPDSTNKYRRTDW